MAQSSPPAGMVTDYDLGRPCRFYLVRHLPAPVRCLVDFQGSWGPGSYADGEFIFPSRDAWLRWRDRDDYKHWRKHEFAWTGQADAAVAVSAAPVAPAEQSLPARSATAILCPQSIDVKIVAGHPVALSEAGWNLEEGGYTARLDPADAPRKSGDNLVCRYRLGDGAVAVLLYQPAGGKDCKVSADNAGFNCVAR